MALVRFFDQRSQIWVRRRPWQPQKQRGSYRDSPEGAQSLRILQNGITVRSSENGIPASLTQPNYSKWKWKFPKEGEREHLSKKTSLKSGAFLNVAPLGPATWACLPLRENQQRTWMHPAGAPCESQVTALRIQDPNKLLDSGATKLRSKTKGINFQCCWWN